jgi:hypothetical protein
MFLIAKLPPDRAPAGRLATLEHTGTLYIRAAEFVLAIHDHTSCVMAITILTFVC